MVWLPIRKGLRRGQRNENQQKENDIFVFSYLKVTYKPAGAKYTTSTCKMHICAILKSRHMTNSDQNTYNTLSNGIIQFKYVLILFFYHLSKWG